MITDACEPARSNLSPASGFGRLEFAEAFNVSRGTLEKFDVYLAALHLAQSSFNLVASSTLADVWHRHFADAAQLKSLGESPWLDAGSGAGFPGIVLAILGERVELVEAVGKKARFLQSTIESLGLSGFAKVYCSRVESLQTLRPKTITARGLAPIGQIFEWTLSLAGQNTVFVLPRGRAFATDLEAARADYHFHSDLRSSITNPDSRIVIATSVQKKFSGAHRGC